MLRGPSLIFPGTYRILRGNGVPEQASTANKNYNITFKRNLRVHYHKQMLDFMKSNKIQDFQTQTGNGG
jgi:hypothetical protein